MFFFFQAEDGIRDYKVTGVQTCALPIFHGRVASNNQRGTVWDECGAMKRPEIVGPSRLKRRFLSKTRSEERRVGKECRSRWRRCQKEQESKEGEDTSAT